MPTREERELCQQREWRDLVERHRSYRRRGGPAATLALALLLLLESRERAGRVGGEARVDGACVAGGIDEFEERKERGGRKGEGNLCSGLRGEPYGCEGEGPEHGEGRAERVCEAEDADLRLVLRARGTLGRDVKGNGEERPERGAAECGDDAGPREGRARAAEVRVVARGVEPLEEPVCGARDERWGYDVWEEDGDAVVGLGGGEHAPDGVGDERGCGEEEHAGEEGRLSGAGAGEECDAAPGVLLLAADGAGSHEPDTDREERREGEDAGAKTRSGRGERGEERRDEREGQEERNGAVLPEGV